MTKNKYTCLTNAEAITFLANNRIPFVCRKGIQGGSLMLYFTADEQTAEELRSVANCPVNIA